MITDFDQRLENFAEVIVKVGLNLQPGQRLLIGAGAPFFGLLGTPIELAPLVRQVAVKAYQAGARLVEVLWDDAELRKIRLQYAPRGSFDAFPAWRIDAAVEAGNAGDAFLLFAAESPDLLLGQDWELISIIQQTNLKHVSPVSGMIIANKVNWVDSVAPLQSWADVVFADLPPAERLKHFWDLLFAFCRADQKDPIAAWRDHFDGLNARCAHLNSRRYAALRFTAPGTDLTAVLPELHMWNSARGMNQGGIEFCANIPTEEIFTLPHKDQVDGIVTGTKPIYYGGGLIEDFSLTFSHGRVVKSAARKGEEILHRLLATDDGASRLGEVALVPHSSSISQSGRLFYNIVLDENASSHLALGWAYKMMIKDGRQMSDEAFQEAGGNLSQAHVDFMIGSAEVDIDGIRRDGTSEAVMRAGEWAFDV